MEAVAKIFKQVYHEHNLAMCLCFKYIHKLIVRLLRKNHELVQEMKETLSEKPEQIICDNLGNCTDDSEIELRNSSLNCLDSQTIGTHSAILSRPNAEMIQLLRNLSLNLENGTILTLSICESDGQLTVYTNIDHNNRKT